MTKAKAVFAIPFAFMVAGCEGPSAIFFPNFCHWQACPEQPPKRDSEGGPSEEIAPPYKYPHYDESYPEENGGRSQEV